MIKKIFGIIFALALIFFGLNIIWERPQPRIFILESGGKRFEVFLPSQPVKESPPASEGVSNDQFSVLEGPHGYGVSISHFKPDFSPHEKDTIVTENTSFLDVLNSKLENPDKFTVVTRKSVFFKGRQAQVNDLENIDKKMRTLAFINEKDEYYLLFYSSGKQTFDEGKWNVFIDSFKEI